MQPPFKLPAWFYWTLGVIGAGAAAAKIYLVGHISYLPHEGAGEAWLNWIAGLLMLMGFGGGVRVAAAGGSVVDQAAELAKKQAGGG